MAAVHGINRCQTKAYLVKENAHTVYLAELIDILPALMEEATTFTVKQAAIRSVCKLGHTSRQSILSEIIQHIKKVREVERELMLAWISVH